MEVNKLIRFKEEAYITVIHNGRVLIFCSFLRCKLHVSIYPSLSKGQDMQSNNFFYNTHFRDALIFQINECWTPRSSRENHLVGEVFRSVDRLNTNTNAFRKKWLSERTRAAKSKSDTLVTQVLAYRINCFGCRKPAAIFTKDRFPALSRSLLASCVMSQA